MLVITLVTKRCYTCDVYYICDQMLLHWRPLLRVSMTPEAHRLESTATFYPAWGTASQVGGTVKGELKTLKHTWGTIQKLAENRQEWRSFVTALHA